MARSLVFTVEEINRSPHLLPNLTLGFSIADSCDTVGQAVRGTMRLLGGQEQALANFCCQSQPPVAAVIGDDKSYMTIPVARLLGIYKFPQISYAASVATLSDKTQFPSFLRTTPSDDHQAYGLARLVIHFGWTWVGILAEESDYGLQGSQVLVNQLQEAGHCVAFFKLLPMVISKDNLHHLVTTLRTSTANVIVVFATVYFLTPVMDVFARDGLQGKVWLASDGWTINTILNKLYHQKTLQGTIGFSPKSGKIPGLEDFLYRVHPFNAPGDIFIRDFWEEMFGCEWDEHGRNNTVLDSKAKYCTGKEDLREHNANYYSADQLWAAFNIYNAVYAIAHALHAMQPCRVAQGPNAISCRLKPWKLLQYIKRVHFENSVGEEIFFDANGNPPALFKVLNWQPTTDGSFEYVTVGKFDSRAPLGLDLTLNEEAIMWNSGLRQVPRSVCSESCPPGFRKHVLNGQPLCCFSCSPCSEGEISNHSNAIDCIKCPEEEWPNEAQDLCSPRAVEFLSFQEPLGMSLLVAAVLGSLAPLIIFCIFMKHKDSPIVKANSRELSFLLLFALFLCFLSSFLFFGKPGLVNCLLRQMAFGISFVLCISCVLGKTCMVILAFRIRRPKSELQTWLGPTIPKIIIAGCTIIQTVGCSLWLIISPPFPVKNTDSLPGKILLECNEGSSMAFWCMLGYMGLLAMVSFIVAFMSRKLPDSFNDAKFITFSMLVFVSVWLSFVPAYISSRGKFMVAVEIFAILSSSTGLMACIFLPKCYIILFKPYLNTKEFLMGRGTFRHFNNLEK
ncbi:extracellular calcium-sensing receptor-like [Ambystoma mexicanum]|uniref:extracellular calcium-sensing receptor-like n=1 Tax=Ambystoma mexicanum TaxID=8296 RepID=UPI0037E896CB